MVSTSKLHDDFGVEVHGINLRDVTRDKLYPEIRTLFETHSLLLFRGQDLDEAAHRKLAELFGPLEDLRDTPEGKPVERAIVSNESDSGTLAKTREMRLLDIQANFLWHTDSTFLPTPSISNILVGYVIPPSGGGTTELVSTRVGWERLPERLKARARDAIVVHRFSQSRKLVNVRLAEQAIYTKFPDTSWRAVWRNPVNGREALYLAAHACGIEGMSEETGMALIDELINAVTQPKAIYAHQWRAGDVLIWDQRATMHRGMPWNYEEERTLASFVSSALESDGIACVRP
jgi:alpha-ketoglutarate-dependent 2,4-dichlorophenoxyacetate dioxygenase